MSTWKLYVRDSSYLRQAEIDDYEEGTFTSVYNDVGTWSLRLDSRSPAAALLAEPGSGVVVYRDNVAMYSGIWTELDLTEDSKSSTLELRGMSDEIWLADREVSPSPGESQPPYTVQASDVRSGVASTVITAYVNVNLGPGAIAARRKAGLTLAADPVVGGTVRGEARWNSSLLEFIQPLAESGQVGFRVVQVGVGLVFQIYQGVDRSASVKFSRTLGNLESSKLTRTRPKGNYIFVGASGSGTSRIVKEFADGEALAAWERIEAPLANTSSTSDTTVITQAGNDALAQGSEQASIEIRPIERPDMVYGIHYGLGDKVAIQLQVPISTPYGVTGQVVDVVRQATISLTKDGPKTVTPVIGTPARGNVQKLVKAWQQANRRLNELERS
ncbi:siphovirus ReqiPepy6 Gp37-like family protein [Amycolatopsis sp. NPDC005961]|uniref:siphovirus ReqiPepy6 Gp37-like family protein n=1 Tax=Amycolatopsis sp. NPDC005961 TaxID=3156720 RepID=UPI00340451A8